MNEGIKLSTRVRIILDIIVIILLLFSSVLLFRETYYVKLHGGQCVANPMGWAEHYAWEEKGERINCNCVMQKGFFPNLNKSISGGQNE